MIHKLALVLLACFLLGACDALIGIDDPQVEVRTDREMYVLGDTVTLTVTNLHHARIGYNFCLGSGPEVLHDDTWQPVGMRQFCAAPLYILAPGESVSVPVPVDACFISGGAWEGTERTCGTSNHELLPARYRISFRFEDKAQPPAPTVVWVTTNSNAFEVTQ